MTTAADYKTAESQVLAEIVAELDKINGESGAHVKPLGLHTTPAAVADKVAASLVVKHLTGKVTLFDQLAANLAAMSADDINESRPETLSKLYEVAMLNATIAVVVAARLKNGESK